MSNGALLVECVTPVTGLKVQRQVTGLIVGALAALVVWIAMGDPVWLIVALGTSGALIWMVELRARAAIKFGFALRVFEDRLEITMGSPPRTVKFDQIRELLDSDGFYAVLHTDERIPLPTGQVMEPAYEFLANRFRHNFGPPPYMSL